MGVLNEAGNDAALPAVPLRGNIGELFAMLEHFSFHAARVVVENAATVGEMRRISGYVVEIRRLLLELRRLQTAGAPSALPPASCDALAERYFALEGMIKELRNDIVRRQAGSAGAKG